MEIYDQSFNQNEWFSIIILVISILIIHILPKRFTTATFLTILLFGAYIGMLSDHTLAIPPLDFYDVNDQSKYELFDFLTYIMYAPFGYFFLYLYDYFNIKGYKIIFYIIFWTILSLFLEFIGTKLGVYHYKNDYRLFFSIPIYLGFQSITLLFYYLLIKTSHLRI